MPEIPRHVHLDFGIETIVDANFAAPAALPDSRGYVPGQAIVREHLAEFLTPATIEQSVVDALRPVTSRPDLFSPVGFQSAHHAASLQIAAALKDLTGSDGEPALKRLAKFLDDKQDLTELLFKLRQLLQQA